MSGCRLKYMFKAVLALTAGLLTLSGCGGAETVTEKAKEDILVGGFSAGASVHDPSVIADGEGKYYIFGSHMEAAVSDNLRKWNTIASGVGSKNPLFENLFDSDYQAFSYVGKNDEGSYSVWAPDVIYNKKTGKYLMYFCTTSSYIKSNLCFAVSDKLEGPYAYVDTVLYSGFSKGMAGETNLYEVLGKEADISDYFLRPSQFNNLQYPNCIDPALFYDEGGKLWMVYGSWSGGIYLLEIDENTGYPIHPRTDKTNNTDAYYGKRLLGGLHNSIEGPYILYEKESGYYYLFVSYGSLTSEGGYQIRVFRSKAPDGPYTDAAGDEMGGVKNHGSYGVKIMGNYRLPSNDKAYMAPGHCSAFQDKDGKMYVVFHTRFDDGMEYHEPRVHQLFITKNGWPAAAPFAAAGEGLREEGWRQEELAGAWYVMNHELDISSEIHTGREVRFDKKGKAPEGVNLQLNVEEGTSYVTLTIEGMAYEGVVFDMTDEAGNETRCITAVADDNRTVWAVHYL